MDMSTGQYDITDTTDSQLLTTLNAGKNKISNMPIMTGNVFASTTPKVLTKNNSTTLWDMNSAIGAT